MLSYGDLKIEAEDGVYKSKEESHLLFFVSL